MSIRTVKKRFSDAGVKKSIFRILRANVLSSMSTITSKNRPHINTAYFCYSTTLEIFFLSYPNSLHCRNLRMNPSMAMSIFSSLQVWGKPDRGMQLFGRCAEAKEQEAKTAERLYLKRFPRYRAMAPQLRSLRFYRFVAEKVKVLDEREFGAGVFVVTDVRGTGPSR